MILKFKKITLHNFGSYSDASVDLCDRGFCLVSGENRYKKDNAVSNGSGKSTIWSAICYALTGETINGVSSNLKNVNIDEESCYVSLEFSVNADEYEIKRIHKPKSDLKVAKNGADISGKGIKESEKVLGENLPELTKDLIASTIILGQGMPNKFSSFNPSGRKALLEKLTKSDFMIEDVKQRIGVRQAEVSKAVREYADSILVNKTQLDNANKSVADAMGKLADLGKRDYDAELLELATKEGAIDCAIADLDEKARKKEIEIEEAEREIAEAERLIAEENDKADGYNRILLAANSDRAKALMELNEDYSKASSKRKAEEYGLEADIKRLTAEIAKIRSIRDVCPTCGQKLPNVTKPSTAGQEAELAEKQSELAVAKRKDAEALEKYDGYKASIEEDYKTKTAAAEAQAAISKEALLGYRNKISGHKAQTALGRSAVSKYGADRQTAGKQKAALRETIAKVTFDKENYVRQVSALERQLKDARQTAASYSSALSLAELGKTDADAHAETLKKMLTLTQRDFRGYLLGDIIKYIDYRAKDYCQIVFGTSDLDVCLNGNDLDISYCGKMFDSLSGGEKQRCDLILQFAIRDLLQNYLNYSSNILVLDEIFDGLDRKSTEKVIDLITDKLKDVESVFVISHHSDELALPVDGELKIVKNEEGISEVI